MSDPETPRERAERVEKAHQGYWDDRKYRDSCDACDEPHPCDAVLLARDVIALSNEIQRDDDRSLAIITGLTERAEKAEAAIAEAAKEINCAGPVAHRIRILKAEMSEALQKAEAALAEAQQQANREVFQLEDDKAKLVAENQRLREERDEALAAMNADTADVVLAKCVSERERDEARAELQRVLQVVRAHLTEPGHGRGDSCELGLWKEPGE